jgi:RNA polymerase sigma-70 factor, ECF subfamily
VNLRPLDSLVDRLYREAKAARWSLSKEEFRDALEAGARRVFVNVRPSRRELIRHLEGLHLEDLALACACSAGDERAWEHFITEQRPILYRAADALDRTRCARELADSLYAELYGVRGDRDARESLFRYFHGRSSLSTWLRAVLAQRYVDQLRKDRRTSPLDEQQVDSIPVKADEPDARRYTTVVGRALHAALARLAAKDRLRLRAYYEQDLTLAQVGRLTGEHEATVSRQLAKTRSTLRKDVEEQLRGDAQLTDDEIARCLSSVVNDAGPLDIAELFGSAVARKNSALERSK